MINKKLFVAGSLAIALAVGCSDSASEEASDTTVEDEESVEAAETESEAIFGLGDGGGEIESRDDLSNLLDTNFEADFEDENTLRVDFEMGDPECQGAQVQVFENSDSIDVSVRVGELPGRTFDQCQDAIGNFFTFVELESPRGDRQIGAAEQLEPESDDIDLGNPETVEPPADGEVAVDGQEIDTEDGTANSEDAEEVDADETETDETEE